LQEGVIYFVGDRKAKQIRTHKDVDRLPIPWKEVSAYIKAHGGSYSYGCSTTKKKYLQLLDQKLHKKRRR
jgi:hypothetical protein